MQRIDESSLDHAATFSNNEKILKLSEKIKCIERSFGSGFHHKIQFGTGLTAEHNDGGLLLTELKKAADTDSSLAPKLITLEFAYISLRNALRLIPGDEQIQAALNNKQSKFFGNKILAEALEENLESLGDSDNEAEGGGLDEPAANRCQPLFNCVWPSKPLGLNELQNLRSSILISIAYVSLCLKDYASTLKYCNRLLDDNDLLNSKCAVASGNKLIKNADFFFDRHFISHFCFK